MTCLPVAIQEKRNRLLVAPCAIMDVCELLTYLKDVIVASFRLFTLPALLSLWLTGTALFSGAFFLLRPLVVTVAVRITEH